MSDTLASEPRSRLPFVLAVLVVVAAVGVTLRHRHDSPGPSTPSASPSPDGGATTEEVLHGLNWAPHGELADSPSVVAAAVTAWQDRDASLRAQRKAHLLLATRLPSGVPLVVLYTPSSTGQSFAFVRLGDQPETRVEEADAQRVGFVTVALADGDRDAVVAVGPVVGRMTLSFSSLAEPAPRLVDSGLLDGAGVMGMRELMDVTRVAIRTRVGVLLFDDYPGATVQQVPGSNSELVPTPIVVAETASSRIDPTTARAGRIQIRTDGADRYCLVQEVRGGPDAPNIFRDCLRYGGGLLFSVGGPSWGVAPSAALRIRIRFSDGRWEESGLSRGRLHASQRGRLPFLVPVETRGTEYPSAAEVTNARGQVIARWAAPPPG